MLATSDRACQIMVVAIVPTGDGTFRLMVVVNETAFKIVDGGTLARAFKVANVQAGKTKRKQARRAEREREEDGTACL